MPTLSVLRELFGHEAWADAEHCRAIRAFPAAHEDSEVRDRLHHIHMAQRAYLKLLAGHPLDLKKDTEPFPSLEELWLSARCYHENMGIFLTTVAAGRMEERIDLPWWPEFHPTVEESLLQVVMHSQYHRGQNAARIRQLGGKAPGTDFALWVQAGRPEARWE